jgi:hypothetical protein
MTECTCWRKYPNPNHKKPTGKWKCVDNYECVRQLEEKPLDGGMIPVPIRKTKCIKKS